MNRDNALKLLKSYCSGIQDCSTCHMYGFLKCSYEKTWEDFSDTELKEFVDILLYGYKKISCYIPADHIRDIKKMINDSKSNVIFVDEDIGIKSDNSSDTDKSNDYFIQIYNPYNISNFTNGRKHIVKFNLVNTKGNIIDTRIAVGYIINSTPSKLYIGNGEDKSFYIISMSDIISCIPMK